MPQICFYGLYDKVAERFVDFTHSNSDSEIKRLSEILVNSSSNSLINQHPKDFVLYKLSVIDPEKLDLFEVTIEDFTSLKTTGKAL